MTKPVLATDKDWVAEDTLRRAGVGPDPATSARGLARRRRKAEAVARREERLRRLAEKMARRKAGKERRTPASGGPRDRLRARRAMPIAACFAAGVAILVAGASYWLEENSNSENDPPPAAGEMVAEQLLADAPAAMPGQPPPAQAPPSQPPPVQALSDTRPPAGPAGFAVALDAAKAPPARIARDQTASITASPQIRPRPTLQSGRLSGRELQALVPGAVTRGTNALGHEFVYRFRADGTVAASTFVSANAKSSADLVEKSVPWRIVGDTLCVNFAGASNALGSCHQVRRVGAWYMALFADGTLSAKFTLGAN